MKRIFFAFLLTSTAFSSQAVEKLQVIDLSEPTATTQSSLPAPKTSATARDAKDFIARLEAAVERGNAQIRSGKIDPIKRRKQAQDLAALQNEAEKFGVLFTPFHKCNDAAISAASSWQGLLGNNARQFENGLDSYDNERQACIEAAN
jgi:hypothetical protein